MKVIATVIGFIVLVVALGLLLAWPTSLLINYVFTPTAIAAIFGTPKIGIVQTWLLSVIFSLMIYRPSK